MDARIAEKFFGYKTGDWHRGPFYTTDPAASKALREKLLQLGFNIHIECYSLESLDAEDRDPEKWKSQRMFAVSLVRHKPEFRRFEAFADSLEMALAQASLKTVGIFVDSEVNP